MDRIEQNLASTVSFTFQVDGVPVAPAPNSATVTITRADGTVLHQNAPTIAGGTGVFSYTLLPSDTAQLDRLKLDWTATISGITQTLTTYVEIVGGFYFSIAEFKAAYPNDAAAQALSASTIATQRAVAEEIIERACHVAFVQRVKRLTLSGASSTRVGIPVYRLRGVIAATLDGTALDPSQLTIADSSVYYSFWPRGFGNVVLTVVHGFDEPPLEIKEAALVLTKERAINGPIDARALGVPTDGGIVTLATPGVRGAVTGIPGVDQAIAQYRLPDPTSLASVSISDPANLYPASHFDEFAWWGSW